LSPTTTRLKKNCQSFFAESFKKWNWSSEKDYQKTIEDLLHFSECKKGYIRELIKGIKTERAQFTKELADE
jgi:hypothetical protein